MEANGEVQKIQNFCDSTNVDYYNELETESKEIFLKWAYHCMFFKEGNQEKVKSLLIAIGEITEGPNTLFGVTDYTKHPDKLQRLIRSGVTTIQVLTEEERKEALDGFIRTRNEFPEYNRSQQDPNKTPDGHDLVYVLGKFAAYGQPSSFHSPWVRELRGKIYKEARDQILVPLTQTPGVKRKLRNSYTEMLFDRVMWRVTGQAPEADNFHRDVIDGRLIENEDELFGGFVNLDSKPQFFSLVPGSHLGITLKNLESGFALIPAENRPEFEKRVQKIRIEPGHMIIFPQYVVHEVLSTVAANDTRRLFTGWRITNSSKTLHSDKIERMKTQSIMQLPSSQEPPMYSKNHASFWIEKKFKPVSKNHPLSVSTFSWSDSTFKESLKTAKNKSKSMIPRFLHSLEYYSSVDPTIKKYEEYTKNELELYYPISVKQKL
jgi:hypothetical protein